MKKAYRDGLDALATEELGENRYLLLGQRHEDFAARSDALGYLEA